MDPVHIVSSGETYVKKFRLYGIKTTFKFNPVPKGIMEMEWVKQGFSKLVEQMKSDAIETDYLGFTLTSLNLKNKDPGYVSFRPVNEVHESCLWDIFGGIIQSNAESIKSTDTFKIDCTRVNLPVGKGGKRRPGLFNNFNEECAIRKGIIQINNRDNLCLARALVVGKAHAKKDPEYKLIRMDRAYRQTVKAEKLMSKSRVQIPDSGAGIPELEKFQDHLKEYNITVYNYDKRGRDVYFSGEKNDALYKINLLFHEGHYNVITSLTAAFACKFYCEACHVPYEHKGEHRCTNICSSCQTVSPPCKLEYSGINCPECNRDFKNQICFLAHQRDLCKTVRKCKSCDKIIRTTGRKSVHVCGEMYCKMCKDFKPQNHECYMQVNTGKPPADDFLFIFFDFETRQDEMVDAETKIHKVNLCVSQQFCWECIGGSCRNCMNRTKVFKEDPITLFMNYVMEVRKKFKHVCLIAHYGQGFDFQFILKYILEETKFTPELIMRGSKIILMEIDNVRFIDSLNYFPMALSDLPKAFDLPSEKKKGYFPHLFNTIENQHYKGVMPPKECYCPDSMFPKGHKEFENWYNAKVCNNYVFDFQKEIVEYCVSDVDILSQACIKFRSMFLEQCNVDPFLEAVTIASACNLAFRRNFLRPYTISLIPTNGYRLTDNQSAIALQWLSWEESKRGVTIQHAGRGQEYKIEGMKVDGFDGERIYEFQGCYYHGCKKCFPYKREEALKEDSSDSLQLRFERTRAKIDKLLKTNYEVVEMWECTFRDLKKENKLSYLDTLSILNSVPLKPRDSFFGGRTGNTKSYYKCTEGESIQYVDVCSLYPWVCKYGKYPIGHPVIHVGDIECKKQGINAEGLLKCKILPPQNLYHPVLPVRMHNKLMFILCRSCGEYLCEEDCIHSEEERALTGTWTMDEVRKAVEKGYIILEMFELWVYKMATFQNGGLFTGFINKFLKLKQEASGYPSWCHTEEDREKYVISYFEHEGIKLDCNKIAKNEGLRSLAKLMLNSFWGKFGQRENQTKTLVTRDPKEFFNLLTSPLVEVNTIHEINEEVLLVNWQYLEEIGEPLQTVNVVLASYTTAQARLKLYESLEALGDQVNYYDTDSVVYVFKEGLHRIPTGDYLGDMTDELAKDYGSGSYIVEFVSGGPKTYAYLVFSTNTNTIISVCKIKGLTLNLETSKKLNFDTLKKMVLSESKMSLEVSQRRIKRTKDRDIVSITETKNFMVTGAKRKLNENYDTLPFGYSKRAKFAA